VTAAASRVTVRDRTAGARTQPGWLISRPRHARESPLRAAHLAAAACESRLLQPAVASSCRAAPQCFSCFSTRCLHRQQWRQLHEGYLVM
jgi:hypothetical protein